MNILLSAIILTCACLISIIMPDILVYFNILGGIFVPYISFVIPTLLFWKASDNMGLKIFNVIGCIVICVIGIAVTINVVV